MATNFTKTQEKITLMDDIKLPKKEKRIRNPDQAVRIYCLDIGMEFSIEQFVMLIMRCGKRHMTEGIELTNQEKKIRTLGEKETYK